MAYEIPGRKITMVAGASLASGKYLAVKITNTGTVIPFAANTDVPFGILQNNPASGGEAEIMKGGVSKLYAGAAGVTAGDPVALTAAGAGVTGSVSNTTLHKLGTALTTAASGELFSVDFDCSAPARFV